MTEEIERVSMEKTPEKLSEKSTVEDFRDAVESIRNKYFSILEMSQISVKAIARLLFLKQVAEILILLTERYPDFFWKTKITQWHTDESPVSSREISTILDIIKYGTVEQKRYFMEMMESAKRGNAKRALELYENYFAWTSIGQAILWHFKDSPLMFSLDERILKTIDKNKWTEEVKKGSILNIIKNHPQWNRIATGILSNIPQKHLDTLFSLLLEIEEYCSHRDWEALKRKIDTYTNIDVVYKDQFFTALKLLSPLSIEIDKSFEEKATKNMEFYTQMEKHFWEQTMVKKEREDLLENKDASLYFTIINDSFPDVEKRILQEKNRRLERLLNNFIDNKGKIVVESGNFKKELLEIFRGSEIGNKLEKGTMNPKEMLNYLLVVSKQQTEQAKKQLAISDPSFSEENLDQLYRKRPEEYTKLLSLLNGTGSTDKKMQALQLYGITTNVSMQPEEQERYIEKVLKYIKSKNTEKHIESILADDKKLALFEQYWSGKIEVTELNAEIAKRDEEIHQLKQNNTNEMGISSAKTYNFDEIKNDFSRIPDNTVLPTKIGDISFTVRKDPNGTATVSYKGLEISGIDAKNSETANDNLNKAAETVRFLEKTGLDIFGPYIPDLLATIRNKQQNNAGTAIELKDGLSVEEKQIFLRYIAKIIFPKNSETPEKTEDTFSVIEKNGGLLRYLHTNKPEYVKIGDSLNIFAIKEAIKNTA